MTVQLGVVRINTLILEKRLNDLIGKSKAVLKSGKKKIEREREKEQRFHDLCINIKQPNI